MRRRPLLRRLPLVPFVALVLASTACMSFQSVHPEGVALGSTIEVQYAQPESLAIPRQGGPMMVRRLVGTTVGVSPESVWVRPSGALASRPGNDSTPLQFHLMNRGMTERVGIVQWPQGATVRESRFSGRRTATLLVVTGAALAALVAAAVSSMEIGLGSGY